jgi:phosphatidylglycerol---prolipoprotein diacylglyceryl transferase
VWEGGLAIHGGVIGGILVGGGYALMRRLPLLTYLDIAAPSLAVGQAIGRWGNFFNEEAFGTPTNLPWKLYISPPHRPIEYAQREFFHPTFLYESVWDALVFVLLVTIFRQRLKRAPGAMFLTYVGLYSLGRFFTEALRTDALMLGPIRIAQLMSIVGVIVALFGVPALLKRSRAS